MKYDLPLVFANAFLPWNQAAVFATGNLYEDIKKSIPVSLHHHLPMSITVLFDKEVQHHHVSAFVEQMIDHLVEEFKHREERKANFIRLGLLTEEECWRLLTRQNAKQPWLIYYSAKGGLGDHDDQTNTPGEGMIPCASMRNHGVCWRAGKHRTKLWLVTSRKVNEDWDWDSDIGHESAHACFAPIPVFVQSSHIADEDNDLSTAETLEDLRPDQIARLCYMYTEIAVIAVRGEKRETESGLPVAERPREFAAFLRHSHRLMPEFGFDDAIQHYEQLNSSFVDVNRGDLIYRIGAPCLKALPLLGESLHSFGMPSLRLFPDRIMAAYT